MISVLGLKAIKHFARIFFIAALHASGDRLAKLGQFDVVEAFLILPQTQAGAHDFAGIVITARLYLLAYEHFKVRAQRNACWHTYLIILDNNCYYIFEMPDWKPAYFCHVTHGLTMAPYRHGCYAGVAPSSLALALVCLRMREIRAMLAGV